MPQNNTATPPGPEWQEVTSPGPGWEPVIPETQDYSRFTTDPKGVQGKYTMASPEGNFYQIPYSNVSKASLAGFKIDPDARETYANDLLADLRKLNPHASRSSLVLPDAFPAILAAPARFTTPWWKQKGYDAVRSVADLLPVAGGFVGGAIGAAAGGPTGVGNIAGAGVGAGIGGAVGEGGRRVVNNVVFNEPTRDPKELAKAMALQAGIQGLSEVTGRAASIPLGAASKYFAETGLKSAQAGIRLLPSEAHAQAPSYIERYLRGSILTSGTMSKFRAAQNAESKTAVDTLANRIAQFTGTSEDLGKLVQQGIQDHINGFRRTQNALYDAIDRKAAGVYAPMANLKAFAQQELTRLTEEEKVVDPSLLSSMRGILENIMKSPAVVKFSTMADARSSLLALVRDESVPLAGKRAGVVKKLANLADESMIDAANKSGIPGLAQDVRDANAFTRAEHERFEQDLVKRIVKTKSPEAIATLLRRKNVGLEELRDLFTLVPSNLHGPVQRQIIIDTAEGAIDPTSKLLNERKFAQRIDALGDEKGRIIFGANWNNVKRLSGIMGQISGPSALGGGGTAAGLENRTILKDLFLAAPVAVVSFSVHGDARTAGLAAVGTLATEIASVRAMAWAMTHPETAAKILKAGQILARTMRVAVPATGAVVQSAKERRGEIEKEKQKAMEELQKGKPATKASEPVPAKPSPAKKKSSSDVEIEEPEASPRPTAETLNLQKLQDEAAKRKPATKKTYAHTATGPDGHQIGSDDMVNWFDLTTGQQVQ